MRARYAQILRPNVFNSGTSETITLIEALPFARELRQLSDRFEIGRLNEFSRYNKIMTRKVSFQEDVNRIRTTTAHASHASEAQSSPLITYATSVQRLTTTTTTDRTNGTQTNKPR